MLSIANVADRFKIRLEIVENGSGVFTGILDEISQNQVPAYVFSSPRRILRVDKNLPLKTNMVIQTQGGNYYLMGDHGDSENAMGGTIFRSFRLFQASHEFHWERPVRVNDPVTGLLESEGLADMTPSTIWGSYEPTPEGIDRETHVMVETARFITNQPLRRQDRIDGKDVIRVDEQLGLYIATLS